jgi:hypothetical protein
MQMSRPRRNDPRDLAPETLLPAIRSWLRPELPGIAEMDAKLARLEKAAEEMSDSCARARKAEVE